MRNNTRVVRYPLSESRWLAIEQSSVRRIGDGSEAQCPTVSATQLAKQAPMQDFQQLRVWQAAHQQVLHVYRATRSFPEEERYGLTSQIRRAAVSVAANIAEGCGRHSRRDVAQFFQIAMGSASEVQYHVLLAHDLGFLNEGDYAVLKKRATDVKRMLAGLISRARGGRTGPAASRPTANG